MLDNFGKIAKYILYLQNCVTQRHEKAEEIEKYTRHSTTRIDNRR